MKQRISSLENGSPSSSKDTIHRLHAVAEFNCLGRLPDVLQIIRTSELAYDTSLTRDGVLFAAFLVAEGNGTEQDLAVCISALRQYRWCYSKSEEREATLQSMWQNRRSTVQPLTNGSHSFHTNTAPSNNHRRLTPSPKLSHPGEPRTRTPSNYPSRSTSPVSPVSMAVDSYESDGSDDRHEEEQHPSTNLGIRVPSARGSASQSDTSSNYRTSHERSVPPRKSIVSESPMEPNKLTTRSGPVSFHKILN